MANKEEIAEKEVAKRRNFTLKCIAASERIEEEEKRRTVTVGNKNVPIRLMKQEGLYITVGKQGGR